MKTRPAAPTECYSLYYTTLFRSHARSAGLDLSSVTDSLFSRRGLAHTWTQTNTRAARDWERADKVGSVQGNGKEETKREGKRRRMNTKKRYNSYDSLAEVT